MRKIGVLEIVMKKSVVSEGYPGFPGITVGRTPRPVNKKLEGSEVTWVSCVRHATIGTQNGYLVGNLFGHRGRHVGAGALEREILLMSIEL